MASRDIKDYRHTRMPTQHLLGHPALDDAKTVGDPLETGINHISWGDEVVGTASPYTDSETLAQVPHHRSE